ncbi:hypothetical protein JOF48_003569 [Arthrobacter stackebrandtii]|uniref:Uncharacterized protein n=1 Tax=Arthrobacter stackebrandtii TaxID=272161 RepID=A0ABS4Z218_9MICC|nr:hypothetical protein [Arthrobacter stackebrandtii]
MSCHATNGSAAAGGATAPWARLWMEVSKAPPVEESKAS